MAGQVRSLGNSASIAGIIIRGQGLSWTFIRLSDRSQIHFLMRQRTAFALSSALRWVTNNSSRFHVVIPSLPGFILSTLPQATNWNIKVTAKLFNTLMTHTLGYKRYVGQGGDWVSELEFPPDRSMYELYLSRGPIFCDISGLFTPMTLRSFISTCFAYHTLQNLTWKSVQ